MTVSDAKNRAYKKANDKKTEMLGMPHGTAFARLRRAVMFDLVVRLGVDTCYRCSTKIECVEELSIEHKDAWQRAEDPLKAFFDLNNISFSHHSCNMKAAIKPNRVHKDAQERGRIQFARYYERNGERWNETRNARRRAINAERKKDGSTNPPASL
jgi:hypothetical protein